MMKYDNNKTLSENTMIIKEQDTFKPEQTFGKCLNKLTFTPKSVGAYNNTDSVSKKLNKWAKSIGESFSYQLYQKSGWNSKKFDNNFTKCDGYRLSINSSFKQDLDRYIKDFPSLPNPPYFCYNQNAVQNRWNPPIDTDLKTPNYVNELTNTFGTLDTCTIFGMLENLPKFDWDKSDKEDWKNIFLGLSVGLGVLGIGATGPMATFLLLGSLVSDLGLASMEYYTGDIYDAGLTLAFSIIPLLHIPGVNQYSKNFMKGLHRKVLEAKVLGKYEKLTKVEREALEHIIKNKEKIIKATTQFWKNKIIESLSKKITQGGLKTLLVVFKSLSKLSKWKNKNPLKSLVFEIGGTYLTYDQLANLYNITNKNERDDKIKEINSKIRTENSEKYIKEKLKEIIPDEDLIESDKQLIKYIDSL